MGGFFVCNSLWGRYFIICYTEAHGGGTEIHRVSKNLRLRLQREDTELCRNSFHTALCSLYTGGVAAFSLCISVPPPCASVK